MQRLIVFLAIVGTIAIGPTLSLAASSAQTADKSHRTEGPALSSRLRARTADKTESSAKPSAAARIHPTITRQVPDRGAAFAGRADTQRGSKIVAAGKGVPAFDPATHPPNRGAASKLGGPGGFVGRHGTGLGDIYEVEPNDSDAQGLTDLPVNVVGAMDQAEDIDFYAITATGGEYIRVEVVADRIFGTFIDSYLVVFDETGDTPFAVDDDYFAGSSDSFIRFQAPDAGNHIYYIGVTDFGGFGGDGYEYVLNVAVEGTHDDIEDEPNDTTTLADSVFPPAVYFGLSDDTGDTDVVTFEGFAGTTIVVDVDAEIFLSLMDPVVELYDNHGGFLFGSDDTDGLDSRFNLVLPYSGTYYLAVYDARDQGGDGYYYTVGISTQNADASPRISGFKVLSPNLLKRVLGSGFVATDGGARAEINGVIVPSKPAPKKPTKAVKVSPLQPIQRGDVITVINPDGRRSNPGVVN